MEKQTKTAACGGGGGGGSINPHLPEEVLIQKILVRLPVVSLLVFKSVCKSWRTLIESPSFIDLHTTTTFFFNSTTTTTTSSSKQQQQQQQLGGGGGGSSFILQAIEYQEPGKFSAISNILVLSSHESESSGSQYPYWRYWDIDGSSSHKLYHLELPSSSCCLFCDGEVIAGSCNGLILIICLYDDSKLDDVSLCLWNPATRQSRLLPKSSLLTTNSYSYLSPFGPRVARFSCHLVAFGFDVKTKDYKVLLITYFKIGTCMEPEWPCRVQVYSLSTDSWRLLEGITSLPGVPNSQETSLYLNGGLYLNGSYFFVGTRKIISFDFTKEIFTTMQLPNSKSERRWYLSCLGDKLALFVIRDSIHNNNDDDDDYGYEDWEEEEDYNENYDQDDYDGYQGCDIWVLNEHVGGCGGYSGVIKESWTKLHFFQIQRRRASESIIPRGILNNGEFALLETRSTDGTKKKMQLYNLVTKEAKTDFLICESVKTVLVYKPSLVSITGGNGDAAAAATDRVINGGTCNLTL